MGLLRHRPKNAARDGRKTRPRRLAAAGLAVATAATAAPLLLSAAPASAIGTNAMVVGAYATGGTTELGNIEGQLGKRWDVDHSYVTFNAQSILSFVGNDKTIGRAPFVNMALNCGCRSGKSGSGIAKGYWARVAHGDYDSWLLAQANAVKSWGGPFYITWQHEPEQTYGWEGTPADYQNALKYIVNLFRVRVGATNAVFVTSFLPTSFRGSSPKVNGFWPGNISGLIAGSTGYNWACSAHTGNQPGCGKGWKTFADVFSPVESWAVAHHTNWWVTETGTAEDPTQKPPPPAPSTRKSTWINQLQSTADHWPNLTGVIFFFGSRSHDLFLPNTSPQSLAAFKFLMGEWANRNV